MYKLENDVAWTTGLKNAFKHGITRGKIVVDNVEINSENGLKNIQIEDSRYVPNLGFIGQATSKKATINLVDNSHQYNLENKEIQIYIGAYYNNQVYYINYGNFIVNSSPSTDSTNGTIKIVAYDNMIKFNKNYVDSMIYPCTLKALLQSLCTQAGVTLGQEHFANEDFVVTDNQFEGKTLREVLQNIAKCAFSWARIGQDDKLYLDFEVTDTISETLTVDDYYKDSYKKANEYYGAINKVTYGDSNITGQEESVEDAADIALHGVKELVINDNYFAYTTAKRHSLVQAGTMLFGLKYMPIQELKNTGLIYLDCTDFIKINDEDDNYVTTLNLNHTIKYDGAVNSVIKTESKSNNEQTYKNNNSTSVENTRTEIIVDRANKKIESISEEIGDRSQKTTTITQDIDGIASKVDEIEDLTNTVTGSKTVTIIDGYAGSDILELHIYGNNGVFNYLFPADDLYPADDLFPHGDSRIRFYNSVEDRTIDLGIKEPLRQNGDIRDEVFVDYTGQVSLIRRINSDGTVKENPVTTILGILHFTLAEGNNTFEIVNYTAPISVKYAEKNTYTEIFATKVEMSSSITQTANEINLKVSRKVGADEIISMINQSAEGIQIEANKISLAGKKLDLTGENISINSNNFSVTPDGILTAKKANIQGQIFNYSSNTGYLAVEIADTKLRFYDFASDGKMVGSICSTYTSPLNRSGIAFYGLKNKRLTIGYKDEDISGETAIHLLIDYPEITDDSLPYIKNTATGTLFSGLSGGGIQIQSGLIKKWNMAGVWGGTFNVSNPGGTYKLTFTSGLLTGVEKV